MIDYASRVRGCLLGGAIGDALGAPVEFMSAVQIESLVGGSGVRDFLPAQFGSIKSRGLITDDTQMTLFTVDGIIRAISRERTKGLGFTAGVLHHAYLRWLDTQQLPEPSGLRDGWLQSEHWLYSRRAPGNTCLSALTLSVSESFGDPAVNDSKGCGGVIRSAPFGLVTCYEPTDRFAYEMAATAAGYTHGHPTGQHASGALALIVRNIVGGEPLHSGTIRAKACIVHANPLGVGVDAASSAAFVWRPEGRVLHLLGPTFICLLGQTKDDIEPQVSVKKLPKTRGSSDNGAGIAVAEFMDRWRDIPVTEVQGSDSVEVLDVSAIGSPIDKGRFEAKMKTFLTTPTIRKAQVSTPSGGVTVDFISSTGTAVTNSDMRMAHLIRVAVPMLVSLDGGEYARIRDAFNVAGSSTEPMLPFGADDGGSGDSA